MVLVEALAAGRAVVAPNRGGPKEILAEGLYPPGDAAAAAQQIERALADEQAGVRARRRAEEHFDVRASTRRLEAAIDAAWSDAGGPAQSDAGGPAQSDAGGPAQSDAGGPAQSDAGGPAQGAPSAAPRSDS
jgi:hypothetical protein